MTYFGSVTLIVLVLALEALGFVLRSRRRRRLDNHISEMRTVTESTMSHLSGVTLREFGSFFDATFEETYRLAVGLVGRKDVAEDIVTDAYLETLRARLPVTSLRPLLIRYTRELATAAAGAIPQEPGSDSAEAVVRIRLMASPELRSKRLLATGS